MSSILGTPGPNPPSPPSQPPYTAYQPDPPRSKAVPILLAAVVILAAATGYLYYNVFQMRADFQAQLADAHESVLAELAKERETSSVSTQTNRRTVENLKKEVDQARAQASQLAGQAKIDATKHADDLAARLEAVQQQQAQKVTEVSTDLSQVKTQEGATQSRVGEVSSTVDTLKTQQATTQQQLEKTIADLKTTIGDLGVQSGLIATNGKELAALKTLGERNYIEFKLAKAKTPEKVGDVQIRLTNADPKRSRYTIELIADDKKLEKKDKQVNEPVQFFLSKAAQPYEVVVNEVRKDMIVGYVSVPKVQQARKQASN